MITIYHNPRCSKSRQGLALVEASGKDFKIIKYLDEHISAKELETILSKLKISPIDLVRQNEAIWKSNFKGKTLSHKDIIKAMAAHPKLIERPIVTNGEKATIGRPAETILNII